MKKLVTAFAACMIAGLVTAAVESINIVGYQTLGGAPGYTVVTPTFISVGSTDQTTTFGAIQGEFEFFDNLQFFDAEGSVVFTAYWFDGWIDEGFAPLDDEPLPAGLGFFVEMGAGGAIQFSGQVDAEDVVVTADAGYTVMGNCRPYDITFADLEVDGLDYFDNLQFFDADGSVVFTAYWFDGWIDEGFAPLDEEVIASGQAFFLESGAGGATITIPAPVL